MDSSDVQNHSFPYSKNVQQSKIFLVVTLKKILPKMVDMAIVLLSMHSQQKISLDIILYVIVKTNTY
jgi:hypothetical protein